MENYALRFTPVRDRAWMTIDSVSADGEPAAIAVDETLARVDLPRPLAPGDSVTLRLHFTVQVPVPLDRFGRVGDNYSVGQWYPKVAVHDDLGWHLDPFHYVSEFYGDYGTFDVAITVPDRYWIGSTGVPVGTEGGDNEVPLARAETPRDSVTVSLAVVTSDSLAGRWPGGKLTAETDLFDPKGLPVEATVPREGVAGVRVPRGAPVHYAYLWSGGSGEKDGVREEADAEGRPGPLHLVTAWGDTSIVDTLRALAAEAAAGDTLLPSLKTVRFRAERVHDFAWVASPHYVRSDTSWSGIAIRALVYRDDQKKWSGLAAMTVDAMRHHSRLVGPYAWPWFTSAEAFLAGGAMEYPMLVMNDPSVNVPYFHYLDDTNAHELGHSWFYGMLGSDERAFPWLDEGFTQYLEDDYTDTKYPLGLCKLTEKFPWLGKETAFGNDEQSYLARAWARDEQPISTPADRFHGYRAYAVGAYTKPVSMLRTLRGVLGDSVYVAFLREYYRRNLFRHPRPQDVVGAAEDVSGRDLSGFFEQWIDGTERASFAIGGVRRERSGGSHRTTVMIRRDEAMVFPVTVEARFKDGTRQEVVVTPRDVETDAVFESRAPFAGAVLDPRHEMVEMNRLDNRTGSLPPIRFHPLAGFPSTEAMGAVYGPTFWEGEWEGVRLGGWIRGRYLPSPDFPLGIRGFEGGLNVGTTNGAVAYRAGFWRRWGALGDRAMVRMLVARDEGLFRTTVSAGNLAMAPSRLHPYRWWSLSLDWRDRSQLPPVNASYWSLDRTLELGGTVGLETRGPRRLERAELTYRRGAMEVPGASGGERDAQYSWIEVAAGQTLDLLPNGDLHVSWRVVAGSALGTVPLERQFDIAEADRVSALEDFYANDRGPLRETEHFFVEGGGGLRGYAGRAVLGQTLLSGGLEVSPTFHGAFLFADVGQVNAGGLGEDYEPPLTPLAGSLLADAGFGFRVGPLTLTFPVWVDHPEPDENPWSARWLFSVGAFPSALF